MKSTTCLSMLFYNTELRLSLHHENACSKKGVWFSYINLLHSSSSESSIMTVAVGSVRCTRCSMSLPGDMLEKKVSVVFSQSVSSLMMIVWV